MVEKNDNFDLNASFKDDSLETEYFGGDLKPIVIGGGLKTAGAVGDINSNEKGSGARYNSGKTRYDLIPFHLLKPCADVFAYGEKKYAAWNWAKGMDWNHVYASLQRHLLAWYQGEDIDPESGLPHLGHVQCNLFMLLHYTDSYKEGDTRPKNFFNNEEEK